MNNRNKLQFSKIKQLKEKYNSRKPNFLRYDWDKYFKLARQNKWVRPRGIDNKSRLRLKGFPKLVSTGYIKPKIIRYLHPSGLRPVYISNINDLAKIKEDEKRDIIIIINGNIGLRKKTEIIKKANEYGLRVANGD
jgi:large subunit ribosomal protein L32e